MYTSINFKTKKAMREAFESGRKLMAFSPGPFPGTDTGRDVIEGPQGFHTWYASVTLINYMIVKMDGTKAYWSMKPEAEQEPGDVFEFHPAPPKVARAPRATAEQVTAKRQDRLEAMNENIGRIWATRTFAAGDEVNHPLFGNGSIMEYTQAKDGEPCYDVVFCGPKFAGTREVKQSRLTKGYVGPTGPEVKDTIDKLAAPATEAIDTTLCYLMTKTIDLYHRFSVSGELDAYHFELALEEVYDYLGITTSNTLPEREDEIALRNIVKGRI
jgi:hypothetical protein